MTPVELLATTEKKIYLFTRETMLFGKHTLIYIKNEFQLTKFDFRNSKSKEYKWKQVVLDTGTHTQPKQNMILTYIGIEKFFCTYQTISKR